MALLGRSSLLVVRDVFRALRLAWWRVLLVQQVFGRGLCQRFGWLAVVAVVVRVLLHWLVGWLVVWLLALLVWRVFGFGVSVWVYGVGWLVVWLLALLVSNGVGSLGSDGSSGLACWLMSWRLVRLLVGWRLAWRVRCRFPSDWARTAAKTRAVQAEVGGSAGEQRVGLRPVLDHPKVSWWPRLCWPSVSWWVSPPPGRSFAEFEAVLEVLTANMVGVVGLELEFERSTSSLGRLTVLFVDPLADPVGPEWEPVAPASEQPAGSVRAGVVVEREVV